MRLNSVVPNFHGCSVQSVSGSTFSSPSPPSSFFFFFSYIARGCAADKFHFQTNIRRLSLSLSFLLFLTHTHTKQLLYKTAAGKFSLHADAHTHTHTHMRAYYLHGRSSYSFSWYSFRNNPTQAIEQ